MAYQQFTIRDGRRETSYTAFIKPVRHRRNLTVATDARVLRVVIEDGEATGVEVLEKGERRVVAAAREVILSAGALASPHLLMLSGVGEARQLQGLGIAPLADLPGVGRNLQDHWAAPFLVRVGPESSYNRNLLGVRKYLEGARYLLTRRGFLALGSSAVSAYVRSSPDRPQPDLQLAMRPVSAVFRPDGSVAVDPEPGLGGAVVLVGPKSVGHLRLASPDPLTPPAFHPNYLGDPSDATRVVQGLRLLRRVLAAEPLARRIRAEVRPAPPRSPTSSSSTMSSGTATPPGTRPAPAGWAPTPWRWWTRGSASTASAGSACPTLRSCRASPAATPTRPRS